MTVRTTELFSTDWTSGEVLTAADLNDTVEKNASNHKINRVDILENALALEERGGWEEIARVINVSGSATEITFTGLAATGFKIYEMIMFAGTTISGGTTGLQFNDQTGTIYSYTPLRSGVTISSQNHISISSSSGGLMKVRFRQHNTGSSAQILTIAESSASGSDFNLFEGRSNSSTSFDPLNKVRIFGPGGGGFTGISIILYGIK